MNDNIDEEKKTLTASFLEMSSLKEAALTLHELNFKALDIEENYEDLTMTIVVRNNFNETRAREVLESKYAFNIKLYRGERDYSDESLSFNSNEFYQASENHPIH